MIFRGENGSGIPVGYRIRVVQIPVFSDTDSGSFIFGTDTVILGYSGRIRVPRIRVPVFSFSA
jgi:hypothetical protein